ncbi:MAG: ABC transporter substrate-binding protein [Microbacterium sp.]
MATPKWFHRRRGSLMLAGIAVATLALGSCSSPIDEPKPAQSEGSSSQVVVANAEPPTAAYWDPSASFGLVDEQVASLVFDTLFLMDPSGAIKPNLATEWTRVSDTELTVTIRDGVKFHDGTDLTADDVVASLNRLMAGDGKLGKAILLTKGAATADGNTVTIKTDAPFGPLENSLAVVPIISKKDAANPDAFKTGANGSGPYKFVSYKGDDITLEANADYWAGAPKIGKIILRYIADADARQNALIAGQADIATRVGPSYVTAIKKESGFHVETVSPPSQIVTLYQHNGPLADPKVRQALAYAVDREAIAKNLMDGVNKVGFNGVPTTVEGYKPSDEKYEYNPEKAKQLLAEAGKTGLTLTMATSTLVPNQLEIDQAIVQYLKDVGVQVDVKQLEVGEFRTSYNQYDLSMNTLASFNNDASFILAIFAGATGEAVAHLKDPELDKLVAAQDSTVGSARADAIDAAASYLWDNQMTLWLTDETWSTIVNDRVQGYQRAPLVGERLLADANLAG